MPLNFFQCFSMPIFFSMLFNDSMPAGTPVIDTSSAVYCVTVSSWRSEICLVSRVLSTTLVCDWWVFTVFTWFTFDWSTTASSFTRKCCSFMQLRDHTQNLKNLLKMRFSRECTSWCNIFLIYLHYMYF